MQTDSSMDAPADAIKFAKNLFVRRAAEPKTSAIKRFIAALQMDLAPGRVAFGERSAGSAEARQLLFDSGDNAVDVRIRPINDGFEVSGQVLGSGFEDAAVELKGRLISGSAKTTDSCTFKFTAIPAGDYELTIRSDAAEIFIEKLTIG
jgi:hypothetical protein